MGLCRAGKGGLGGGVDAGDNVNVCKLMKVPIRLYNSVFGTFLLCALCPLATDKILVLMVLVP